MVSFQCEACGDVLTKKKLDPHRSRCRAASFTCIDCMVHFYGTEYRTHTSCITEDQKYQGALYKNKKAKTTRNDTPSAPKQMAHVAYVEDFVDNGEWEDTPEAMPHAPSPPPLNDVNVFDYMVGPTPHASQLALPQIPIAAEETIESTQLVRFEYDANLADQDAFVEYGDGPVSVEPSTYETPVPKVQRERKKKDGEKEIKKKDKKRKRDLHVETHDHEMTDAPPVLHSNLTGGMDRLMSRNHFPPSPDYSGSGGDVVDTPASPLKKSKSKHTKSGRGESSFGNIMSILSNGTSKTATKTKTKSKKLKSTSTSTPKKRHSSSTPKLLQGQEPKLLEYKSESKNDDEEDGAMVVFKPQADLFLSFANKDSDKGCSVRTALKRFHRERSELRKSPSKAREKDKEEKELFRSLRMRKNDRGEIVLFCV